MTKIAKDYVYVVSFVKEIDEYELPQAVISSMRGVAKFLGVPKSTVISAFGNGVTVAYFDRWQIEKVYIGNDRCSN